MVKVPARFLRPLADVHLPNCTRRATLLMSSRCWCPPPSGPVALSSRRLEFSWVCVRTPAPLTVPQPHIFGSVPNRQIRGWLQGPRHSTRAKKARPMTLIWCGRAPFARAFEASGPFGGRAPCRQPRPDIERPSSPRRGSVGRFPTSNLAAESREENQNAPEAAITAAILAAL